MTRNLKILVAAALALTALGAVSATGAQAADEFHCSTNPCKLTANRDGVGATGHQVFIIENAAKTEAVNYTCHEFSGDGELSGGTSTQITFSAVYYVFCTVNGSPGATWSMNGCDYRITASTAGKEDKGETHLECPGGQKIGYSIPGIGCTFDIGPQTVTGVGYHTVGAAPNRELTVTFKNLGPMTVTASAGCAPLINPNQPLIGTWTTGNFIFTGETSGGAMAEAWFA